MLSDPFGKISIRNETPCSILNVDHICYIHHHYSCHGIYLRSRGRNGAVSIHKSDEIEDNLNESSSGIVEIAAEAVAEACESVSDFSETDSGLPDNIANLQRSQSLNNVPDHHMHIECFEFLVMNLQKN